MEVKDIIRKVKQIEIRTKKRTESALMGQYHSAFKGQGMTFSEVRPYQYGDEIRRIDWNKTARFQTPFVKVMEEERELTMMILVDLSSSMNYGTGSNLKREKVAEIAATLGFSALGNQDKVGLILYSDKVHKVLPPKKGRKHILTMISLILSSEYASCEVNFDKTMQYMMGVFKKKSLVFVLSDFHDSYDLSLLKVFSKKHQVLGLKVEDEKDQIMPDVGYMLVQDAETGKQIWVNTSNARWRYHFAESNHQKNIQLREDFSSSSADLLFLKADEDYTRKLYQYFQKK